MQALSVSATPTSPTRPELRKGMKLRRKSTQRPNTSSGVSRTRLEEFFHVRWAGSIGNANELGLEYLRDSPTIPNPAPNWNSYPAPSPRAQTVAAPPNRDDLASYHHSTFYPDSSPSLSPPRLTARTQSSPEHSDSHWLPEQLASSSFARPPRPATTMALPDPSQFPDPYPFRPSHSHLNSLPALSSSGGSTSTSTRSSAYTSSGSNATSGEYNHVHIASGDEDAMGAGITSDSVSQLLAKEHAVLPSARQIQSRAPVDHSRWSDAYSSSARSRSSSIGNSNSNTGNENPIAHVPDLQQKPSYDISWQTVDEKDEVGMSEDETDDEPGLEEADAALADAEEERTSAAVVAEEGRGLIVHAEKIPIVQLQIQPGTTHLLIGQSTTPNALPSFLTNTLPQIAATLLALDISANFLGALPPVLAVCENLEELNVASNPLRVLPVFLAELSNLCVLIADATGICTIPDALVDLEKLHTLSIRRNKLHSLPSWLCLLPGLKTLCVDSNPFQGPWKALVEPLLAKAPVSPAYPPSTPMFPPLSATASAETDDHTDVEDMSDQDPSSPGRSNALYNQSIEEEDHTITPERAPKLSRSITSPPQANNVPPPARSLQRTRTTPNRAYFDQTRNSKPEPVPESQFAPVLPGQMEEAMGQGEREIRKMKSAGDLRRGKLGISPDLSGARPTLSQYAASVSSSNLLDIGAGMPPALPANAKRFASLGPATLGTPSRPPGNAARPQLSKSMWDESPNTSSDSAASNPPQRKSYASSTTIVNRTSTADESRTTSGSRRPSRDGKEKNSRWGFLKKMSMGKIKGDTPSLPSSPAPLSRAPSVTRPPLPPFNPELQTANPQARPMVTSTGVSERMSKSPQIDLRFSTTGILDMAVLNSPPSPPKLTKKPSRDLLKANSTTPLPHPPPSTGLLSPPAPTPRGAKRRSFLPFEQPGSLSIPIPETAAFVPNVTASNEVDEQDPRIPTPSPTTPNYENEQYVRREEERAREAYMRALRSVMAYLKDMNDLAQSQQPNPLSMYGYADDIPGLRSRRPTVVDRSRELSMMSSGSSSDASSHLRSSESMAGLRSGTSSQTLSVATTDSNSSMDERKYKDNKGKRTKIIQEIVSTERTYVNGLQELVDIYIKPASVPVNLLSGVGSSKDTLVPAAERKVVFGGIDALYSFHHDSFLPALEKAAIPLYQPDVQEADADGTMSSDVAKAIGDIFVKHAAFMRMYSSYINNFDSSVQRVKSWTTPGGGTSPSAAISPTSSTAQLVGLSISIVGSSPSADVLANGIPALSSSQRRRIKSYLKRCRMNPRHAQLNLEGYLLLPVQRIPRYKLLLEELVRCTPPSNDFMEDPLDRALSEISSLANNMNEGKRESESRRKLVQWQTRIRGKFPSPLVQPHRRLIMDGPLLLTRVVRKAVVSFEAINAQGDASTVQVDCLAPELTPRPLVGILCNDLLVLCRDPSDGKDPNSFVDLWAVLRMQTLPQPASIVHGNALRLVDNKAILYFDAPTPSDALNWYRAINLHIPASKA